MKRVVALLSVLVLIFALSACSEDTSGSALNGNWKCNAEETIKVNSLDKNMAIPTTMLRLITLKVDSSQKKFSLGMANLAQEVSFEIKSVKNNIYTVLQGNEESEWKLDKDANGKELLFIVDLSSKSTLVFSKAE